MNGLAQKELLLQKLRAAALKVGTRFSAHPDVAAVLVFGSAASGQVDDRSDVDLLVVCRCEIMPLVRQLRLGGRGSLSLRVSIRYNQDQDLRNGVVWRGIAPPVPCVLSVRAALPP